MGAVAHAKQQYGDALRYYQESMDIVVELAGTRERDDVADLLFSLATVTHAAGWCDRAQQLYEDSLRIKEKLRGTRDHPQVAVVLYGLGSIAQSQGRTNDAVGHFQEALGILQKCDPDHAYVPFLRRSLQGIKGKAGES
ncbi:hypothetical protein DFJ73DRAFT_859240 [Zopfochytrium polystomum]|nr:hypothetical protein DFJ73DRAFT_859240 [Zopfochytrium polystomum]